jgi:uncharacterized membrane protein YphA (DoxX/SURF4 family)
MPMSQQQVAIIAAVGRVLLASLFILGGINKVMTFAPTAARMGDVGLEPASILLPLTIVLELAGGLALAVGRKGAVPAALVLAIFTLASAALAAPGAGIQPGILLCGLPIAAVPALNALQLSQNG